jgi:hypothetical protein
MKRYLYVALLLVVAPGCTIVSMDPTGLYEGEETPASSAVSLHVVAPSQYDGKLYVLKKQSDPDDETVMLEITMDETRPSVHMEKILALLSEFEQKTGRKIPPGGVQFLNQQEGGSVRDNGNWDLHQYEFTYGIMVDHMPAKAYELTYNFTPPLGEVLVSGRTTSVTDN